MGISVQQLLIILAIIVLLFGAKKIPELAKGLGKGIKSFKAEMEDDKPVEKVEKKEEDVVDAKVSESKTESKNA
ncbi:twin-arginine translocase TatA/TatE family subunit [Campylobacter sp. RM9344]|uniref:Sec-independent protein translocase protein TatA n=1 Tax=Campylobacter californiensis TaxID=1032243 RepID=A0AAW3ZVZ3_9BACT|nr:MULTISPECIES: twin-arginine translocase TatA/TatE family subunit [unclassified Campylobacter]MBE2984444.1 twin-arginine translocase TatA/TatE family subunit [Campylobacter sp. RM6883]MBE2985783.1 twin-arginine translocase TatA/TatE family subunit [Campylobacter sp. RM12919]MBE2987898.1 twin-arginine translocase TatA/TatE family subunit [Campylobacter sp. RM12920]MBE2995026.1 twin-arginine translocase TatA/TatE family subunit [Campylobacter sp. RM6913]MBE3028883.1 twin-arginine translocase T